MRKKSLRQIFNKITVFAWLLTTLVITAKAQDKSIEQKIAGIFAFTIDRSDLADNFKRLTKECENGVGMLILSADFDEEELLKINNFLSRLKSKPLMVFKADNQNWPSPLSIGAITENSVLDNWSVKMGEAIKNAGYDMCISYYPGITNPKESSSAISFAINEDWEIVSEKTQVLYKGLGKNGLGLIVPDFPGFKNYSQSEALQINYDFVRIRNIEMQSYKNLISSEIEVIQMSSALIKEEEIIIPFFMSAFWTTGILSEEEKFKGLIMTPDVTNVSTWFDAKNGEIEQKAFEAGCNIILNPSNPTTAIKKIKLSLKKNKEVQIRLESSLERMENLNSRNRNTVFLAPIQYPIIEYDQLLRKSITVLDQQNSIPVKFLENKKVSVVYFGADFPEQTLAYLDKYDRLKYHHIRDQNQYYKQYTEILTATQEDSVIIVMLGEVTNEPANNFGIGDLLPRFVEEISKEKEVILLATGNPSVVDIFNPRVSFVLAYEDNINTQRLLPQVLFGAKGASAVLPYSTNQYVWNTGKKFKAIDRLDYVFPEEEKMNSAILSKIDEVAEEAIQTKATPGCQVLVARNGHIVLEKSYGYLSYDSLQPVTNNTVYDIASVTKVAATLQAVMLLSERDVIDVNKTASNYLVDLRNTNKDNLFISEILAHQSGLTPYIAHWRHTMGTEGLDDRFYCDDPDEWFCVEVTPGIYTIATMEDSVWKWTLDSELISPKRDGSYPYKYSDLGFYIMKKLVERTTRQPIEHFLDQNFYAPLGMSKLTFFPLAYYDLDEIAPTEDDQYFRKKLVRGTVHDQGAAMFGGVGGHAGLFSNALDLAKLMHMNLNKGSYGGLQYLKPNTIETFTDRHFVGNRRGLGWDKPLRSGNGPTSDLCSYSTFGHTGFTGTSVWADPEYGLVFVFLSNRIHPDANNRKLLEQNIRTRIQDIVYESIFINDINNR